MDKPLGALLAIGAVALASCGRPDASGIYLAKADREVALIQLVQTKDGAISGRAEVVGIGPGGVVTDQSANLDGAASKHDLVFKPASAWFGRVSASGSFTNDSLTIAGNGSELKARKASLDTFEKAATRLRAKAADERRQIAEGQAKQAGQAADVAAMKDAVDKTAKLKQAASELRIDALKIDKGVAAAPDYAHGSAENTAKVAEMLEKAPALSSLGRSQLSVSANNVAIATYQIEIARYNYALGLNQIIQHGSPIATAVQRFCDTPQAAQFSAQCTEAKAAATDFQSAIVHGYTVFKGYKQAIRQDEDRQNDMARKIAG